METQKISYANDISRMMFGFGDSHKPNPETVQLVESIVLSQLRLIVREASKYIDGQWQGGRSRLSPTRYLGQSAPIEGDKLNLNGDALVFLMRKNKQKMRRFVKYLHNKELKKRVEKIESNNTITEIIDLTDSVKHPLIEFIEKIDEVGELTDLNEFDEIKYERELRADRISQVLDEQKYLQFAKARSSSFMSKRLPQNFERLKRWIDPSGSITFTNDAVEVLSYYAYETVAQIVDYALLIRKDSLRTGDPISCLNGHYFNGIMFNGDHRFSASNPDYSRVYDGQFPISVAEIKETMRRLTSPQVGKLNFSKKPLENNCIICI